jgi:hypothetical protein
VTGCTGRIEQRGETEERGTKDKGQRIGFLLIIEFYAACWGSQPHGEAILLISVMGWCRGVESSYAGSSAFAPRISKGARGKGCWQVGRQVFQWASPFDDSRSIIRTSFLAIGGQIL